MAYVFLCLIAGWLASGAPMITRARQASSEQLPGFNSTCGGVTDGNSACEEALVARLVMGTPSSQLCSFGRENLFATTAVLLVEETLVAILRPGKAR